MPLLCHWKTLNFQWQEKTTHKILISTPWKLRVNEVPLGAEILNLIIAVLGHSTANWMPMDYQCNGIPSNYHMNVTRLSINCHLTVIWLPHICHSTATRISVNWHLTTTWLPLECQSSVTQLPLEWHWNSYWQPMECHSIVTWIPLDCQSTAA